MSSGETQSAVRSEPSESTPLLAEEPQPTTDDGGENAPASELVTSPTSSRSHRILLVGNWILLVASLLGILFYIAIIVLSQLAPHLYLPWYIRDGLYVVLLSIVAITWAIFQITQLRRRRAPLPLFLSLLVHAVLGLIVAAYLSDMTSGFQSRGDLCERFSYDPPKPDEEKKYHECLPWAAALKIVYLLYYIVTVVITVAHGILFVATLDYVRRNRPRAVATASQENGTRSWSLPTGQLALEFRIKLLPHENRPDSQTTEVTTSD